MTRDPRQSGARAARSGRRAVVAAPKSGARWRWLRSPITLVLGTAALAALALFAKNEWDRRHVTISFVRSDGPIPTLELDVFPDQLAFGSPSPPPQLAQATSIGGAVTFGRDEVPERAVVRYRGDGIGCGVVFVELGKEMPPVALVAPRTVRGHVGSAGSVFLVGWHVQVAAPIAGATVLAMAGGEHGIPVGSAVTGSDGGFTITGIASDVAALSLRVRAPGHAIRHVEVRDGDDQTAVAVERTRPVRGTLRLPPGLRADALCLVARGLPGVEALPAADGSFVLDHVPADVQPRLIVHGLDALHGQLEVRADPSGPVTVEVLPAGVLRGRVVDAKTLEGRAGALVYVGTGDAVRTDDAGRFELMHVLSGEVELTAQWQQQKSRHKRGPLRYGRARTTVVAGTVAEGIVVPLE